MGELANRRAASQQRLAEIVQKLSNAEPLASGKACIYATGSFGRCEVSPHSDLDLFIASKVDSDNRSVLSRLDEICIKAELINVTRKLAIPDFSGDGEYLTNYSQCDLVSKLGTPQDDVDNTLTARLLLLLESKPIIGRLVYDQIIENVVATYWRDYADHQEDFRPAYLANDILRLWRTFCVNYEARTQREPDYKKAKGKLKNYKLKHSRLLTCYSGLLFLLAVYRSKRTVSPSDALQMAKLTPTERLEWLLAQPEIESAHASVKQLLDQYEAFLARTNRDEGSLIEEFRDNSRSRAYMQEAQQFGETVFQVLTTIGEGSTFHRLLVV